MTHQFSRHCIGITQTNFGELGEGTTKSSIPGSRITRAVIGAGCCAPQSSVSPEQTPPGSLPGV